MSNYEIYNTKEEQIAYFNRIVSNYINGEDESRFDRTLVDCFDNGIKWRIADGCFSLIPKNELYDMWFVGHAEIEDAIERNIEELEEIRKDSSDVPF